MGALVIKTFLFFFGRVEGELLFPKTLHTCNFMIEVKEAVLETREREVARAFHA